MEEIIGAVVHFGYGQETERGTAVAPTRWLGKYEFSFMPKSDKIMNESGYGHLAKNSGMATLRNYGEGDVTAKIFDKAIGDFLKMVSGQEPTSTPVGGQASVVDHVFSLLNSNMHPSYTLAVQEGGVADHRYPGAILSTLSLDVAVDDYAKMTAGFLSEEGEAASNTPAYTQENEFTPSHASVKLATKGTDMSGAEANAEVRSVSLEFNKNPLRKETIGNKRINPRNGRMEVTGEIELYFSGETIRDWWKNDTELALRLEVENTDVTIGSSTHPKITVDLPFVMIENWEGDYGADDLVPQTISIHGLYDASNGDFIEFTVRNTEADYDDPEES
jgi:hypothetical protein